MDFVGFLSMIIFMLFHYIQSAAVHGPGGPSMAAALGLGGPIVGGPLVV